MNWWNSLVKKLRQEDALLGGRITSQGLKQQYQKGRAFIVVREDAIVAFSALWSSPVSGWLELGTAWCNSAYRNQGLGGVVIRNQFAKAKELKLNEGIRSFLMTHNPAVIHLAHEAGWKEVSKENWHVVPWDATCGLYDEWNTEDTKRNCPCRVVRSKCRLFID